MNRDLLIFYLSSEVGVLKTITSQILLQIILADKYRGGRRDYRIDPADLQNHINFLQQYVTSFEEVSDPKKTLQKVIDTLKEVIKLLQFMKYPYLLP
jgi:response regulator of citrate/malate metabolism